jgi:hypothetical protein
MWPPPPTANNTWLQVKVLSEFRWRVVKVQDLVEVFHEPLKRVVDVHTFFRLLVACLEFCNGWESYNVVSIGPIFINLG